MRSLIADDSTRPQLRFHLPLDPARLLRARHRIRDFLHEYGVQRRAIEEIVLAVEEAMTNAVRHSGGEDVAVGLGFGSATPLRHDHRSRDSLRRLSVCRSGYGKA